MKKNSSSIKARVLAGIPFLFAGLILLGLSTTYGAKRNARANGQRAVISPSLAVPAPFSGTYDATSVFPCSTPRHHFMVPAGQVRIVVNVVATLQTNDLEMTLLYGSDPNPVPLHTEDTGVGTEAYNYQPPGGVPAGEYQVQICESSAPAAPSMAPFTYNGTFTYDNTAPGGNAPHFGALPAAPQDSGPKVGYENFEAPGVLTPVIVTSSGGATVEYLGRGAGEPSIGVNWNSTSGSVGGMTNFQSDLETLFISWDQSCSPTIPKATWVNRRAPTSVAIDSDPIGFTDHTLPANVPNRVFAGELTLLSPDTVKISHSDDDGVTWVPDQSGGIASAVDHETIGGGRYHAPIPSLPTPYPNAVYYCSQDIAAALCSRSDDGGSTYGPSIAIYSLASCGGLHGHVKVSPVDGTVYVPNRSCNGAQSVVVSQDNGATWTVHAVDTGVNTAAPSMIGGGDDPAVSIDGNGRVYFAFSNFGGGPGAGAGVAISDDLGSTWKNMFDVGAIYGLKNVCFPAATAGDGNRAAISFYGSVTPESPGITSTTGTFNGVWHLYVAHTFDGGKSWTTTDATPTLPMQRSGILRGGSADIWRNLLDFYDMTIDRDGRVQVGYVNGCSGGNCAQAPIAADGTSSVKGNAYSASATIARQSSGRRMLAANDPASSTSVPGIPFVTERRIGNTVRLAWNESDSGNSMINNYQILRSTSSGTETPLTTVAGTQTGGSYTDNTATDLTKTYYYKVIANNSIGSSCGNNEIAAPYVGDTCTGIIIHKNDPTHPESTGGGAGQPPPLPSLLIDYVAVSEPPATNNLTFTIKVGDLSGTLPPNSRWRIAWDWYHPTADPTKPDQMYYIGMNTDQNSAVTFEYGTLADAGVPALLVLGETKTGVPTGSFSTNGTITMSVAKSAVGSPQTGDLLGAIGGKTMTGDTPATVTFERSTSFVDHTFIKGQADNAYPAATYTLVGNTTCSSGTIVPVSAVSRKIHGSAGTFDVDLPLNGAPGIECRTGGPSGNHTVRATFAAPVTVTSATVTPGAGGTGSVAGAVSINGSVVTVNLTNVSNAQTLTVNLLGVSDGTHMGNVSIPMSVLAGDTTANGRVNSSDISQTQSQSGQPVGLSNYREDVTVNGLINSSDISLVQSFSGTALP
ncbi:MAG: hypothetical protein QOI89_3700 [Solirubrobacteraceae bacterium]|nr:hypothetical protein [Solirubrobacteraceae bacterium]